MNCLSSNYPSCKIGMKLESRSRCDEDEMLLSVFPISLWVRTLTMLLIITHRFQEWLIFWKYPHTRISFISVIGELLIGKKKNFHITLYCLFICTNKKFSGRKNSCHYLTPIVSRRVHGKIVIHAQDLRILRSLGL